MEDSLCQVKYDPTYGLINTRKLTCLLGSRPWVRRRKKRELTPLAECSCDIIWPGTERELLKATGAHAARQRSALAKALSDLVLGQAQALSM